MDTRLRDLTVSPFFLMATLLAALVGCRPVSSDEVSHGGTAVRTSDTIRSDVETGIVYSAQSQPARDLFSALAEALHNEMPPNRVTTEAIDTTSTETKTEIGETNPSTSDGSVDTPEPPNELAVMADDPTSAEVLNEAPAIDP